MKRYCEESRLKSTKKQKRGWQVEEKLNMTLEQYKEKVFQCLTQKLNTPVAERLMTKHEPYFKQYLEENYEPGTVAIGMLTNLL